MAFRSLFTGLVAALCLPAMASAAELTSLSGFSDIGRVFLPLYATTGAIVRGDGEGLK